MTDRVKKGDAAGFPIYREPRRHMPQEEGSWVSLLDRGVDLLSHTGRRRRGGGVEGIHAIRFQDGGVVAAKRVSLGPEKYAGYVQIRGAKSGWPMRPAMVKGPRSPVPKPSYLLLS